jgi:hypothetical protein
MVPKALNIMNNRLFTRMRTLIAAVVLVALSSSVSRPIENPAIINLVDYSTVPPSSYESNSISSPINIDLNGNLVITGNVRRGMHFRDTVPYESTTSFRADLGSSSLSSFLRDSAGTEDLGNLVNRYRVQPYYLRSRTVATTRPGYPGVFGQEGTGFNNNRLQNRNAMGTYVSDSVTQTFTGQDTSSAKSGLHRTQTKYDTPAQPPIIVKSIKELQQLTQKEKSNLSVEDQLLLINKYRRQIKELRERTQKPEDKSQETDITIIPGPVVSESEQKQSPVENYNSFNMFDQSQPTERAKMEVPQTGRDKLKSPATLADEYTQANTMTFPDNALTIDGGLAKKDKSDNLHSDIFEQVKKELEDLIKIVEPIESQDTSSTSQDIRPNIASSSGVLSRKEGSLFPFESVIIGRDELKKFSLTDLSPGAGDISGSKNNPENFSMSRFNHHFQKAQEQLKSGRYFAAADSFAMASIYKADEPLCLAGRGHALLAAGEYISSALFLSRAIEVDSEFLKKKIDLAATLGGQHILGSRIADIKEWLLRSGSGQLDFLLGYIYYRIGRLGPAQEAIDAAYAKMPQSAAVLAVKKAVEDAIGRQ